jgi:hypothetical protein
MFVEYVWPFRELRDSTERKTFFWLECSYDEALDVLHQVKLSAEDFRSYVEHLHEFRSRGLGDRQVDQGLEVYTRIGFLISEDGKIVEWAPPGFPIANMWDAYNPFERVEAIEIHSFDEFAALARTFRKSHPYYSTLVSSARIPSRVHLASLKGEDPERVASHLIGGSPLGLLGCRVFFSKYVPGAFGDDEEAYFAEDNSTQRALAEKYEHAQDSKNMMYDSCKHTIHFEMVSLSEIYQRKTRAIMNLRRAEKQLESSGHDEHFPDLPVLKALSDDEICELSLLMERHHRSVAIKWILGEFIERVSSREGDTVDFANPYIRICPSPRKPTTFIEDPIWGLHPSDGLNFDDQQGS